MLPNKLITLCLRPHIPCFSSSRYLRGGYTIEVKKVNRQAKSSEKEKKRRFYELESANVGVGAALHIIEKRKGYLDPDIDNDEIEDITLGAENVDSQFKQHIQSAYGEFDRKSLNNIKRKYFKEPKLPNMVPYCEKQDMKFLHENDPETWDVEKLSESFPVTPEIAKKILRSPFTARTIDQVKAHDRTVKRNWERFKEGKLDISPELRNHYEKFVNRVSIKTPEHVIKKYLPPEPNFEVNLKYKEFGSIIDKYQQTKSPKPQITQITEENDKILLKDAKFQPKMITEDVKKSTAGKSITLAELRKGIRKNPQQASELSKVMIEMEKKYLPAAKPDVEVVRESDYLADAVVVDKSYEHSLPSLDDEFPLRIRIPKDKWKRNKVYQVKDRFYNDSGHFLYRVPGLFN